MVNEEIISQIANTPEVLDPSWVLNLITVAAAFLLWNQIKDIKNILKGVNDLVQLHERDIAVMKHQINTLEKNK